MSKEYDSDGPILSPKLLEREYQSSGFKNQEDDDNCELQSLMPRRNSATKGKQMMDIKRKSQDINLKLQTLENRIKFIENEQIKAQKNILLAKQKFKKRSEVRQLAESEKKLNATAKEIKIKEILDFKEKVTSNRDNQKQRISIQKEKLLKKNFLIKKEVKNSIFIGEAEMLKKKQVKIEALQRRNKEILNSSKEFSEKKKVRTDSQKAMKEKEYLKRMQDEMDYQKQACNRIKTLEKLEELLMEHKKTSDVFDTFDSDLLSLSISPLNITTKLSLF
ncbi:hypothetical protein SteCoe_13840 [Stentor coeruleus]|uniref:Uncharacterized protein n=1 Tax=Stentor coeruleus TaxID=5963 RepID=A0A1R2C7D6_9CILI|nr:hypothetical protein SteCoe_13840 [Stentor coeruleus]